MKELIDHDILQHMEKCDRCHFEKYDVGLICCECSNTRRYRGDKIYIIYPRGLHVATGYAICETCLNEFYDTSIKFRLRETSKTKLQKSMNDFKDKVKRLS